MDKFKQKLSLCVAENVRNVGGEKYNHLSSKCSNHLAYGTAGFRADARIIKRILHKVGLMAGLRCLVEGTVVGLMITASHNPVDDNGVKLIDSKGEMLAASWEPLVERFCNLPDDLETISVELLKLAQDFGLTRTIDLCCDQKRQRAAVLIGCDTRPSSDDLVKLALAGLRVWSSFIDVHNYGQVTTPALHYLVAESNKRVYGTARLEVDQYYKQLIESFSTCFASKATQSNGKLYNAKELIVDCANGVGFVTMRYLTSNDAFNKCLPVQLINCGQEGGVLNHECGADFVKTKLLAPRGANEPLKRYASLDGDADRLIYFYLDPNQRSLRLLDGDKILALFAKYLKDVIEQGSLSDQLSLGVVQTAYANGASTDYLAQQLGLQVDCVDTGVKNLHRQAQRYDVAIYFEANGHGAIWFSDDARTIIETVDRDSLTSSAAVGELRRLLRIANSYTGDAISDMLVVEIILNYYDMNIESWFKLYQDRPNCLTKVQVSDRNLVLTTDANRRCLAPVGLQKEIDALVEQFGAPQARCFVRPSGTEDVVRIYAEAQSQEAAEDLAQQVSKLLLQMCSSSSNQ